MLLTAGLYAVEFTIVALAEVPVLADIKAVGISEYQSGSLAQVTQVSGIFIQIFIYARKSVTFHLCSSYYEK